VALGYKGDVIQKASTVLRSFRASPKELVSALLLVETDLEKRLTCVFMIPLVLSELFSVMKGEREVGESKLKDEIGQFPLCKYVVQHIYNFSRFCFRSVETSEVGLY